jgi:hypothetical protein
LIILILYERPLLLLLILFFLNFIKSFYLAIKNPFKNKIDKFQIYFNYLALLIVYGLFIEVIMISIDMNNESSLDEI